MGGLELSLVVAAREGRPDLVGSAVNPAGSEGRTASDPSGMVLDTSGVEFHEGEKGGEDYVAFHFPRQIEGRPTITSDTERVVFHCKASAKTERPGRPDSISVRVVFEPNRMRAAGQPDL